MSEASDWQWPDIEKILQHANRVVLSGPPGIGKTTAAHRAAVATGRACFALSCTEETPAAELRGHWMPGARGAWHWHHGPAVRAWLQGGVLVLNEIDRASADLFTFLHNLLDSADTAAMTLPSGATVRPLPGFSCVATTNGDPDKTLDPALRDRFTVHIPCTHAHPGAVAALPDDLRGIAVSLAAHPSESRRFSVRALLEFARLRLALGDEALAARAVLGTARGQSLVDALKIARAGV